MPTAHSESTEYSNVIIPAKIEWQIDDTGNKVPISGEFGDVYFSHADGLAESRHVFLESNRLPQRLTHLAPLQCFTVAELGFGTGLNLLATWQLWRELRLKNPTLATSRLHFITTEKHPIPLADLQQILRLWSQRAPELSDVVEQLLTAYPSLVAGCHRLNFSNDNFIVDIWLGDATDSLAKLSRHSAAKQPHVDAWFLDGFAPSCNQSLWDNALFAQIQRLSHTGTTAATYSCAGVVKRALQESGFEIKKVAGFGRKKEMLTAIRPDNQISVSASASVSELQSSNITSKDNTDSHRTKTLEDHSQQQTDQPSHIIVIGAGVSGLMAAWSLANRDIRVTLLDKTAPLAGASGNPRALLAPKMTPIHHVEEHLHTIGYLYSSRLYRQLNERVIHQKTTYQNPTPQNPLIRKTAAVLETTGALDLLMKANINSRQIVEYPDDMATTLTPTQAQSVSGLINQDLSENLYLPQSGLVNPQALKEVILTHPLITFQPLEVNSILESETQVCIEGRTIQENSIEGNSLERNSDEKSRKDETVISIYADHAIICAAYDSHGLDSRIFECRKIRGQLSWFKPTTEQYAKLPKIPLKYNGYCALFTAQNNDATLNNVIEGEPYLLLGASFVRNDIATDIRQEEHLISRDKIITAIPELESIVPTDTTAWQARAGVRTQTPDYHPIVGQLADSKRLWTLSAMGAKGYAFAPICAEVLADMLLGGFSPLSNDMLSKLSPNRSRLQTALL